MSSDNVTLEDLHDFNMDPEFQIVIQNFISEKVELEILVSNQIENKNCKDFVTRTKAIYL